MSWDFERVTDGYMVLQDDGPSLGPMERREAYQELIRRGMHTRDAVELLGSADRYFETGRNEERRALRALQIRATTGLATDDDLTTVRMKLRNPDPHEDLAYFVDILERVGWSKESEEWLGELLAVTEAEITATAALGVLSRWTQASTFPALARSFIRGASWDHQRQVQRWAIAQAGWALKERRFPELLELLVAMARNPREDEMIHSAACTAIADATGAHSPWESVDSEDPNRLEEMIRLARARLGLPPEDPDA